MNYIKLFSGMDFSGKSTIINGIYDSMPGVFKKSKKFLTPISTLQEMIDNNIWMPRDEFIPVLKELVITDIQTYRDNGFILQDTLWIIKFTARLLAEGDNINDREIHELLSLIKRYPDMDSYYITTTMEERRKRFVEREKSGKRISRSDRLLFEEGFFEEVEKCYKNILFEKFPKTYTIDTTNKSPETIIERLKKLIVIEEVNK